LEERRQACQRTQESLHERQRDYETLRGEIARALRGEGKFPLPLLRSILEETEQKIQQESMRLHELEVELQNAEQLRRETEVKQLKYCGLHQIFTSGTMEEKKMLLSILVRRVEIGRDYQMNIVLSPEFDRFLDGLIELR
jgi:hypothetical protein